MSDRIFLFPIPGFPGYWLTRDTRVYSTKHKNGKTTPRVNDWKVQRPHPRTGHLRVDLRGPDARWHTIQVQRLVAWTFIGPQPPDTLVCHKNGNEDDNDPDNLYYGTHSSNALDREDHRRAREESSCPINDLEEEENLGFRDDTGISYVPDAELGF